MLARSLHKLTYGLILVFSICFYVLYCVCPGMCHIRDHTSRVADVYHSVNVISET